MPHFDIHSSCYGISKEMLFSPFFCHFLCIFFKSLLLGQVHTHGLFIATSIKKMKKKITIKIIYFLKFKYFF
jgi:hypothetical protein